MPVSHIKNCVFADTVLFFFTFSVLCIDLYIYTFYVLHRRNVECRPTVYIFELTLTCAMASTHSRRLWGNGYVHGCPHCNTLLMFKRTEVHRYFFALYTVQRAIESALALWHCVETAEHILLNVGYTL